MILEDLVKKLYAADGYMVTVSVLNEEELEHFVITEKFRKVDMLSSHKETKIKIMELLEKEDEMSSL